MTMASQRIAYVDNIRAFLIALVVLGHCLQDTGCGEENILYRIIYSFHMPLFMAVSAYISYTARIEWRVVAKRAIQLLIPFACWAIIKSVLFKEIGYVVEIILQPDKGLWFLWALFFIIVIMKLAQVLSEHIRVNINIVLIGIMALLYWVTLGCGIKTFGLPLVAWQLPFYYLGWILRKRQCMENDNLLLPAMCFALWMMALVLRNDIEPYLMQCVQSGIAHKIIQYGYSMVEASMAICSMIPLFGRFVNRSNFLGNKLGRNSLAIYAITSSLNVIYINLYTKSLSETPYSLAIVVLFLVVMLFCVILIEVLQSSNIARLLLFGKPMKR